MTDRGDTLSGARAHMPPGPHRRDDGSGGQTPGEALVGLVLCGGQSRRMGADKAALTFGGSSLLERTSAVLTACAAEVYLSVGGSRRSDSSLPQILDRRCQAGPLAGLEAGLTTINARHGTAWVLTLACDMPWAEPGLFKALFQLARSENADAALLSTEKGDEPLYAVYNTRLLPAITAALDSGERRLVAFYGAAFQPTHEEAARAPRIVRLMTPRTAAMDNLNTPEDFARARRRAGQGSPAHGAEMETCR